jgi:hypothetical protein
MHARVITYNSSTGQLDVDVLSHTGTGTFAVWTVNVGGTTPLQSVYWGEILGTLGDQTDLATALNAKLETSTAASTYAALSGATFTGEVSTPASTTGTAGLSILPGTAPSAPTNGEIWNTGSDIQVRLGGVTETLAKQSWVSTNYAPIANAALTGNVTITANSASPALIITQDGAGDIVQFKDVSSDTTYSFIDQNGKVNTVAATTNNAGFNIPHGTQPTTPVDGDIWTTTGGLFWRQNGSNYQAMNLGGTQTASGSITFSNANLTFGNSTAASTINIGTGATLTATTKAINIGTNGVSGSTTNIAIGTTTGTNAITINGPTTLAGTLTASGATITVGNTTAASTVNIATGATLTATTKAVNIGTAGVAGSTTNIAIGTTAGGTSTTTMQGTTTFAGPITGAINNISLGSGTAAQVMDFATGVTATGLTKAVSIGTGGATGSTTTISLGATAGTSTTTLNGTTNGVTAAADTNSVALATTAYVVGQAGSATPLINGTAAVGTSLRYARQDHVHPTDTSRAPLASPSLTGTPLSTTAAADTNTTQIATTAYVVGQASATSPAALGTATVGTSLKYARADHAHLNPLPTGGTAGQVLSKIDATNYNVQWSTPSGGGTDYQAYTTAGTFTWTKPANAKWVEIYLWGAGGGGGSGASAATTATRTGGSGGGGGGILIARVPASTLGATESVVVGAAGTGGVAQTVNDTAGNTGGTGGSTTFSVLKAQGSVGGTGGSILAGNVAGVNGGTSAMLGSAGTAGPVSGIGYNTSGGNATQTGSVTMTYWLPTGGGGGGGQAIGVGSAIQGGNGGIKAISATGSGLITAIAGGVGGTSAGVAATVGVSTNSLSGGGTGGGGGYSLGAGVGGTGGAGGFPAGGGGGGGGSDNGFNSGAGGAGAIGAAYIITYC